MPWWGGSGGGHDDYPAPGPGAYDNGYNAGTADAQYDHDNGHAENNERNLT